MAAAYARNQQGAAPYCDRYRSERDVQPLLDLEIARAEDARHNPQSTMSWGKFFDQVYLPHITTEKRASTIKGYNELWAHHVKARLGDSPVRDLRTVDVSHMLRDIAANNDLTSMTLRHIKAFCSGLESTPAMRDYLTGQTQSTA